MPRQLRKPTQEEFRVAMAKVDEIAKAIEARAAAFGHTTPTAYEAQVQFDVVLTACRRFGPAHMAAATEDALSLRGAAPAAATGLVAVLCGFVEAGGRVAFIDPPEKTEDTH